VPHTEASDVHAVLHLLDAAGVTAWVAGGWGVDALAGWQTRQHGDVDLLIPVEAEAAAVASLEAVGYRVTADWRPTRVALSHPDGPQVDLHPIHFLADGTGVLPGLDGERYEYPPGEVTTGLIAGRRVTCISARLQIAFHIGYPLRDLDRADLTTLTSALAAGTERT
jgi:lincosamide nucleotidyltransferase A/C/D/E